MSNVAFGPLRQIAIKPTSDPTAFNFNTFLTRDDSYSRGGASLGRTLRLGDPITTGPLSAAYQSDFSGGAEQSVFTDTAMFYESNFNSTDPAGQLKMWPGLHNIRNFSGSGSGIFITCIQSAPLNGALNDVPIIMGQRDASGNGSIVRCNIDGTGSTSIGAGWTGKYPTAMCYLNQSGGAAQDYIAVGFSDGTLLLLNVTSGTYSDITHPTDKAAINAIAIFQDKLVLNMDNTLWTRDYTGANTWVKIKTLHNLMYVSGLAVNGNSIYISGWGLGNIGRAYVSDGSTVTRLYEWSNCYTGKVLFHLGTAYFAINEYTYSTSNTPLGRTALFAYNGSTMRRVADRMDNELWGAVESYGPVTTWGKFVAIGVNRFPTLLEDATLGISNILGVMLYDPETDSVHAGPNISNANATDSITAITSHNNQLVFGVNHNNNGFSLLCTRRDGYVQPLGFGSTPLPNVQTTRPTSTFISSVFDGGMPEQPKTWVRVQVKHRIKAPADATIRVYGRSNAGPGGTFPWTSYGSFTLGAPSGTTTRTTVFNLSATGLPYPVANQFQLKVVLETEYAASASTHYNDAIIEAVTVEYMVAPTTAKVWRLRAVCSDGQERLDDTANPLATRSALAAKLWEYWESGRVMKFWEPSASPTTPAWDATSGTFNVMITDINETSFRVTDEDDTEVVSEVTFTLYEVTPALTGLLGTGGGIYFPTGP